jgi:hypothetical protein
MLVEGVKPNAVERARALEPSLDVSIFSAAEQILSAPSFVGPLAPSTRISKGWGEGGQELRPPGPIEEACSSRPR